MPDPFLAIDGLCCGWCGSAELRCVAPGNEAERHELIGPLRAGTPTRGWCCLAHFDLASHAPKLQIVSRR